jgi:hypothetical protein
MALPYKTQHSAHWHAGSPRTILVSVSRYLSDRSCLHGRPLIVAS